MKLYEKLAAIQATVLGLEKDKQGNNYKYVTLDKVLNEIKPLMVEHKLLLKQEVLSIVNVRQDYKVSINAQFPEGKPKSEIHSTVMMKFTWVDTESGEKDENLFGANGQNDWDKGVGSALTYGERYFLLKYFHIATDEDDIDNPELRKEEEEKLAATITEVKEKVAQCKTIDELNALFYSVKNNSKAVIAIFADRKKEITK